MIIANYEILEKLSEAPQSAVFKAYHKNNPNRVLVLKLLKAVSLSRYKQAQFLQKIEHLKDLNDPLVITPISFDMKDEICFITQEHFDGITLTGLMKQNTRCFLVNPATLDIRLVDFPSAVDVRDEPFIYDHSFVRGTPPLHLPYTLPVADGEITAESEVGRQGNDLQGETAAKSMMRDEL